MKNIITNLDLSLITQPKLDLFIKIEILNEEGSIVAVIQSNIIEGNFKIDSESDIRRTCSMTLKPDASKSIIIDPEGYIWLNKTAKIYIGVKNLRTRQYVWFTQGVYYFKDSSSTYDATTNTLSITACDNMVKLDGSKSGIIGGALNLSIPSYEIDEETGEITKYNIIRDAMISTLVQLGGIKEYMVDDFGEQNGIEQINSNWEQYRSENPLWNVIPYDLEFSAGSSVLSVITTLRDLYPNYEVFFDIDGVFIGQMIPNCDNDEIIFDNSFFQKILISENKTLDLTSVRNICEVWGDEIDIDYHIENTTYYSGVFSYHLDGYEKYKLNDKFSLFISEKNDSETYIKINDLDALPVYNMSTNTFISKGILEKNKTYCFKISRIIKNNEKIYIVYLLGQWQPHAITAIVDGKTNIDYTTSSGLKVKKYSEEYFKDKYNCNVISLTELPNSPFTVEKIGELLEVKEGGEYENITSDSLALERAEYENWKLNRLTDSITLKTIIVPFADVNVKCSYKCSDGEQIFNYVVKSIDHNFQEGTTTWTMYRHYPTLKTIMENKGTHKALSAYPHNILGLYSHDELSKFLEGGIY